MEIIYKICFLWILITFGVLPVASRAIPRPVFHHARTSEFFVNAPLKTQPRSQFPTKFENSALRSTMDLEPEKSLVVIIAVRKGDDIEVKTALPAEKNYYGLLSPGKHQRGVKVSDKKNEKEKLWNRYPIKIRQGTRQKTYNFSDLVYK